jgi:S-(hydroxymethyl)glutathione dehydrogenase/alcohol dehydrogenase
MLHDHNNSPLISFFHYFFYLVMKSGLEAGQSIAIIGLGGVGLSAVYAASKIGAKQIIAIDINPAKFELAKKLGATHFINPKDHPDKLLSQVVMEMTDGQWGVDFSVECVGNVELMKQALHMTTKGWGKALIVGVATGAQIESKSFYLVSQRQWSGMAFGSVKPRSELPQLVDDIITNKINIDDFITNHRGLEGINQAFDDMHSADGVAIRTSIDMWQ